MTAITIFIVIVKEGGAQTLLHVLFIVFIGSVISNSICFVLWPQSATTNLQSVYRFILDLRFSRSLPTGFLWSRSSTPLRHFWI